ncbi:hypothetical protein [Pseudotamlana carrageenivorans]|uniref:Uncharacterized protein n=1 Tax=Pseudotamlana carrageenivorans TaxID=2069432 RepID=A0A2I7SF82_9FLAO|nr:hypothetical protein [Tamlana carrageenivorans]AUS04557.1 hypothetical protein C1A40_03310 [Tamlana carrageenivorans]
MKIKNTLKLIFFTFLISVTYGCKQEDSFKNYKYDKQPDIISCKNINTKLLKEAVYSFEDDILKYTKLGNPNNDLAQAYNQTIRSAVYRRLRVQDIASPHSLEVLEALKKQPNLWAKSNEKTHLNYQNATTKCIANNLKDRNLKTTFNALLNTNSLTSKLFGTPLMTKYRNALNDKHLATYIALDLFYAKLIDTNLDQTPNQ